jgi:hypothetical protein
MKIGIYSFEIICNTVIHPVEVKPIEGVSKNDFPVVF